MKMIVNGIIQFKGQTIVSGHSNWNDNLQYKIGDIISDGTRQWKITEVDKIHQGSFGVPDTRYHNLKIEPIGHDEMPNIKDALIKE